MYVLPFNVRWKGDVSMIKYFQSLMDRLSDIVDSMTNDYIKIPMIQYCLTLLQIAIVVGLCFLCIYWGIDIVGNLGIAVMRGL